MEFTLWFYLTPLMVFLIYSWRARSSSNHKLPPGPVPLPIIGSMHKLGGKPHRSFFRLAKSYGPVMSLKLGQMTTIVVSSPELAREVLQKKDQAFCSRSVPDAARALRHHEASMAWLPVSQPWRNLRKICNTQLFVAQKLDENQSLRRRKVQELIDFFKKQCVERRAVDVGHAAFVATLNFISTTLFSADAADTNSGAAKELRNLMLGIMREGGSPNLSDFFPCLRALDLQGKRRRNAAHFKRLHEMFDQLIDRRLQTSAGRAADGGVGNDFLGTLVWRHLHGDGDQELDRHSMKSLLMDLFVGGSDTSSNTVEWVMAELLRNPSIMVKARAELIEAIELGQDLDESSILRLPYLQAVIKETLRLHPPVPLLLPRKTESSVELCGYTVPSHSQVLINVWAIGRDGAVWPEPEVFMPERFLGREVDFKGRNFELTPFGGGRRICPGLPLANRMVHLILASLLRSFDWKLPDGMEPRDVDMTEKFGITLARAAPLEAIPILATA